MQRLILSLGESEWLSDLAALWHAMPELSIWRCACELRGREESGGVPLTTSNAAAYFAVEDLYNHRLLAINQAGFSPSLQPQSDIKTSSAIRIAGKRLVGDKAAEHFVRNVESGEYDLRLKPGWPYELQSWQGNDMTGCLHVLCATPAVRAARCETLASVLAEQETIKHDRQLLPQSWSVFSDEEINQLSLELWKNPPAPFGPRPQVELAESGWKVIVAEAERYGKAGAWLTVQEPELIRLRGYERKIPLSDNTEIVFPAWYMTGQEPYCVWISDAKKQPLCKLEYVAAQTEEQGDFCIRRRTDEIRREKALLQPYLAELPEAAKTYVNNYFDRLDPEQAFDPAFVWRQLAFEIMNLETRPSWRKKTALAVLSQAHDDAKLSRSFFGRELLFDLQVEKLIAPPADNYCLEFWSGPETVNLLDSGAAALEVHLPAEGVYLARAWHKQDFSHSGFVLIEKTAAGVWIDAKYCDVKKVLLT